LETYIVEKGWIALVELIDERLEWRFMHPGDVYTTRPMISHNVDLAGNAVIHTVKHGGASEGSDWYGSPNLDEMTKSISSDELDQRAAGLLSE
jgi:hypothetical protein